MALRLSILLLTLPFMGVAQERLQMSIFYANFFDPIENKPYLESYFSVFGPSMKHKQNTAGLYDAGVEILLTLSRDNKIHLADRIRIPVNDLADTTETNSYFQQTRLSVDTGVYELKIELFDINNPEENYVFSQEVNLKSPNGKPDFSAIQILENYKPAPSNEPMSKSGYLLHPMIPEGDYYLGENHEHLKFYTEFYPPKNLDNYILRYYLRDALTGKPLNRYAGFARKSGGEVNPLLLSMDISKLRSGSYFLQIEAVGNENTTLAEKSVRFFRNNPEQDVEQFEYANFSDLSNPFQALNNIDSLSYYIETLYPISTPQELRVANAQLQEPDLTTMKRFFYSFWEKRNPAEPYEEWEKYYGVVQAVNRSYSTMVRPGFRTDRGRIYLQYGEPSLKEQVDEDRTVYPYEIWQYNELESNSTIRQVNQIFIFANKTLGKNSYELIHSTAMEETQNPRWRLELQERDFRTRDPDYMGTQARDRMGSRMQNNIIINGGNRERSSGNFQNTMR